MNKKLLYPTLISVAIQLIYIVYAFKGNSRIFVDYFLIPLIIFTGTSIYAVCNLCIDKENLKFPKAIINIVCVVLSFPLLFIIGIILVQADIGSHEAVEVDPGVIHLYDKSGNEIPEGSLLMRLKNEDSPISRIKIDSIKE